MTIRHLMIERSFEQALEAIQGARVHYYWLGFYAIVPKLIRADAEQAQFQLVGNMRIGPLWWMETSRLVATLSRHDKYRSQLRLQFTPMTWGYALWWVALALMGVVLLRLRAFIWLPYIILLITWGWGALVSTVQAYEQFLEHLLGQAVPFKRDEPFVL